MNYRFDIPPSKDKLRQMRRFVTEVLQKHQITELEINMMVLAVDEVFANIIIHGQPEDCNDYVRIIIEVKKQGVWFEIIDKGAAFDILKYNEPVLGELVKSKHKGGMGIMLVKKIMDEIKFKSSKNQNSLRLYKKVDF